MRDNIQELKNQKLRQVRNRQFVVDYLVNKACSVCKNDDSRVLEFDHIETNSKLGHISDMVHNGCSIAKISQEISKCQILCRNCHKLKTYSRISLRISRILATGITDSCKKEQRQDRTRLFIYNYLKENPCMDCHESNPHVLEFDHIDPTNKRANVSLLAKRHSLDTVITEMEKCVVLCGNCHAIKTHHLP